MGDSAPKYGSVLVGLWMRNAEENATMLRAIEERLRNIAANDPDRPQLETWRKEAMNMQHRAAKEEWTGWEPTP